MRARTADGQADQVRRERSPGRGRGVPPTRRRWGAATPSRRAPWGGARRWPSGEIPPATYPVARSAAATSAIAARLPPSARASALRSSCPAPARSPTASAPSTLAIRVLNTRAGSRPSAAGRLLAVRRRPRVVLVGVQREGHAGAVEGDRRRGAAGVLARPRDGSVGRPAGARRPRSPAATGSRSSPGARSGACRRPS